MTRLLVAGVAVADFVFMVGSMPDKPEKYRAHDAIVTGGGNAANAAVAICRQGGEALLAAHLGEDPVGTIILDGLLAEGVDTRFVQRASGAKSSFSSIYVDARGERQIMNFRGSGMTFEADHVKDVPPIDAVLADNRRPALTRHALALARERGVPGVVDAEDPISVDDIAAATHIAFSLQGLAALTGQTDPDHALRVASRHLPAWLCVTDGSKGAYFLQDDVLVHSPAFPVDVVDTLGAGDVWHGVFALRLAEGDTEAQAVRYANAAAALKCRRAGGRNGTPGAAETAVFLKSAEAGS